MAARAVSPLRNGGTERDHFRGPSTGRCTPLLPWDHSGVDVPLFQRILSRRSTTMNLQASARTRALSRPFVVLMAAFSIGVTGAQE